MDVQNWEIFVGQDNSWHWVTVSGINLVIYRLWDWIINWRITMVSRSHGDNECTHDYQASKCIIMDSWWYKLTIQCYLASWTPPLSHAVWKSHNINIIRDDVFPVFTTAKHRWCSFSPTGGIGLVNQARQAWKTVSHDRTPRVTSHNDIIRQCSLNVSTTSQTVKR